MNDPKINPVAVALASMSWMTNLPPKVMADIAAGRVLLDVSHGAKDKPLDDWAQDAVIASDDASHFHEDPVGYFVLVAAIAFRALEQLHRTGEYQEVEKRRVAAAEQDKEASAAQAGPFNSADVCPCSACTLRRDLEKAAGPGVAIVSPEGGLGAAIIEMMRSRPGNGPFG